MNDLLEKRPEESFSNKVLDNIQLISFNNFKPSIMGTASLKSQLYSVDLDLYSVIKYKSIKEAKELIEKNFKEIVRRIARNPDIFFMDFKLGYNNELYQTLKTKEEIKEFYNNKKNLLTAEEINKINSIKNLDDLKEYTRKLYTLRWSPREILQGYKIINKQQPKTKEEIKEFYKKEKIPINEEELKNIQNVKSEEKKTISESLDDKSVIKLDILAYIDGEFIEMTNLFEFLVGNKPLNFEEDSNVIKSIKEDIIYYYDEKNYIKMLKRIFTIAKLREHKNIIKKLVDIFNSGLGRTYQVSSNLENIINLIEKLNNTNLEKIRDKIITYIQELKSRLGNVYEFEIPLNFYKEFDKISKIKDFQKMSRSIEDLREKIKMKLNKETLKRIKKDKINFRKYLK